MDRLRNQLVEVTLAWEKAFGNAPLITTVISEHDAARLVGCSVDADSGCVDHPFRFALIKTLVLITLGTTSAFGQERTSHSA